MSSYDKPEQIEARRAMFSKFAKLQVIKEEKRRIRIQLEPKKSGSEEHYRTWRSNEEQAQYCEKELEYVLPYQEEYKISSKKDTDSQDKNQISIDQTTNPNDDNVSVTTDASSTSTTTTAVGCTGVDIVSQLRFLRNRHKPTRKVCPSTDDKTSHESTCKITPVAGSSQMLEPCLTTSFQDFERTSTILPPTEVASNEYKSNITIEELRRNYFSAYKSNKNLPIYKNRRQIIDSINSYSVVIIEGSTGCGKTTQVPMYILEDAVLDRPANSGAPVIYVTQPRRIAARSIAERVCNEHNWALPSIVGYQVSLDKVVGQETVLIFCTAGVLLQKIIQDKSLKGYTHIIIDEAHERDADTDLLMMMIRKLMHHEKVVFRLIIMSATMDINKLKNYFTFKTSYSHQIETTPSYIHAGQSDRSASNIQTVYLDTLRVTFGVCEQIPEFDYDNPELIEDCLQAAVKIIVEVIPRLDNYNEASKSTLVFLPGLAEISRLDRMIRAREGVANCLDIIPLHSCLTVADQLRVFRESRPGCRKVILATNIAESSITVTDVGFIIDFCLTKILMKDDLTRFPTLKLLWATRDKCTQRSGRTGRCCPGKVFRMVPQAFFRQLKEYAEPELLTAPLELSVLRVKNFQMGEVLALFAVVIDPPPYNEIRTAVLELKQIGALAATYKGKLSAIDGDLTELGRVISLLPIDVHLSKLIVIASVFDVIDDAIIVAACLSTNRTVVRYLYGNTLETYGIKLDWARGSQSDLSVSLDCYKEFKTLKTEKGKHHAWLASWCNKNYLDERKLHDVDAMVVEITERLQNVNLFANMDRPNQLRDSDMDNLMLKISFCAAFYPNYFLTEDLDREIVNKELNGLDPTRTVIMSGLPVNQVPLYKTQITKEIRETISDSFDFIAENSRAYLVFNDQDEMSTEGLQKLANALDEKTYRVIQASRSIPQSVYKALKFGENTDNQIREYNEEKANERMNFFLKQREEFANVVGARLIPSGLKVLDPDRIADNRRLIEVNDVEFAQIMEGAPYMEVNFNSEQDAIDQHELFELEAYEIKQNERNLRHNIFKPVYRHIKGPDSPIRMSFRSVLTKSTGYKVDIDSLSVNSVLLDPDYEKVRRQMLVAATVNQSKKGRVLVRDTTLMPNIRGFPTLMALLFAQYYRLIWNKRMKCVSGAMFGIGWDLDDTPLDAQYEVNLGFDVHVTEGDIALINSARRMISKLLKFTEIQNAGKPQAVLQEDLRKVILTLLRRRRYPLNELDITLVNYAEAQTLFTKDHHNMPHDVLVDGETRPFLPLMLTNVDYSEWEMYESVRANLQTLEKIKIDVEPVPTGGIKCLLCGNGLKSHFNLGLDVEYHVTSKSHQNKLLEFEAFEERAREAKASNGH